MATALAGESAIIHCIPRTPDEPNGRRPCWRLASSLTSRMEHTVRVLDATELTSLHGHPSWVDGRAEELRVSGEQTCASLSYSSQLRTVGGDSGGLAPAQLE